MSTNKILEGTCCVADMHTSDECLYCTPVINVSGNRRKYQWHVLNKSAQIPRNFKTLGVPLHKAIIKCNFTSKTKNTYIKKTKQNKRPGMHKENGFWQWFFFHLRYMFLSQFPLSVLRSRIVLCCFNELSSLNVIKHSQALSDKILSEGESAAQIRKYLDYFQWLHIM